MRRRQHDGAGVTRRVDAGTAHVVICNWRDLAHHDGGGSERYVETVARHLAGLGNEVTILCARVAGRPRVEASGGVTYVRAGGRFTVYLRAAWTLARGAVAADVVLDVQNGIPFLSPIVARVPVAVLVHHVHREQWPVVFGRLGRIGWWLESRVAPALYRRSSYLTVSERTKSELAELGVDPRTVTVAYNGTPGLAPTSSSRSATPRVAVLGRVVPHKRVEIAIRACAALREGFPDLALDVVGDGWWLPRLRELTAELGVDDMVRFHGFVDEQTKSDLLAQAWVHAVPSIKEGWGLSVVEAATRETVSIAFADAGGLAESIIDGQTGVLVDGDERAFTHELGKLLADGPKRAELGRHARAHASEFTWSATAETVTQVLDQAVHRDQAERSPGTAALRPASRTITTTEHRLAARQLISIQGEPS